VRSLTESRQTGSADSGDWDNVHELRKHRRHVGCGCGVQIAFGSVLTRKRYKNIGNTFVKKIFVNYVSCSCCLICSCLIFLKRNGATASKVLEKEELKVSVMISSSSKVARMLIKQSLVAEVIGLT